MVVLIFLLKAKEKLAAELVLPFIASDIATLKVDLIKPLKRN